MPPHDDPPPPLLSSVLRAKAQRNRPQPYSCDDVARISTTGESMTSQSRDQSLQRSEFWLPLPPVGCSSNARFSGHWSAGGKARRDYRAECGFLLPTISGAPAFQRARISVVFWLGPAKGRYHPRDAANGIASLKACLDAIVDRNWLPDDSAKYLSWGSIELMSAANAPNKDHFGRAGVCVTLERLE